ncbi:unnamed protein product [Cladocopium goreaui]|uniref:3-methyl-2-oxobutanoate hydroxymethyltransferase n=1 Tax=Cladocopium goreaui TaxID=2562237 RepID=A0A9P1CU49_9DINO|nr:unnamed protein product [Cladocopium goreaui]
MPQLTAPQFTARKGGDEKLVVLTAYDHTMARLVDAAGVDAILVGDSLGMVVQGRASTVGVTIDQMIYHAEMVGRAVENALTIVDLPFPINHYDTGAAIDAAARILKETGCQSVKLEGGEAQADTIHALVTAGIPVMAHVGLRPQSVHQLGGYKVQRDQDQLSADARAAAEAGAYGMVVECVPTTIAAAITDAVPIPTIGIGAGPACDGQVLVVNDLLGLTSGYVPRFVKQYADVGDAIGKAVGAFAAEVRRGEFPGADQAFELSLRTFLIGAVVLGTVVGLLFGPVRRYATSRYRIDRTVTQMSRVGSALLADAEVYTSPLLHASVDAPELSTTTISWRALLVDERCACLDHPPVLTSLDWDDSGNAAFDDWSNRRFFHLLPEGAGEHPKPHVVAVAGEDTAFEYLWRRAKEKIEVHGEAILLMDVADFDHHWMSPHDITVAELLGDGDQPGKLPTPVLKEGRLVVFADGETWLLSNNTPEENLLKFVTVASAERHDREKELGGYALRRINRRKNRRAAY